MKKRFSVSYFDPNFCFTVALTGTAETRSSSVSFGLADGNGGKAMLPNVQEEASRILKNSKSEHIHNYTIQGSRGESIGLILIEMASK